MSIPSQLLLPLALAAILIPNNPLAAADAARSDQKARLAKLQPFIGVWKGVGQPKKNSTKDSWIEQADWAWKFQEQSAALAVKLDAGKYFSTAELQAGEQPDTFVLAAKSADGKQELTYQGGLDKDEKLTLTATKTVDGLPTRLSFRLVAGGDRLVVLLERPSGIGDGYARLAEIGYTRKGSGFGQGAQGPECVVTGGYGSIEVMYKGQRYFVCCTGCRDYFNDKPEEVLAEYQARKAAEKAKKKE